MVTPTLPIAFFGQRIWLEKGEVDRKNDANAVQWNIIDCFDPILLISHAAGYHKAK